MKPHSITPQGNPYTVSIVVATYNRSHFLREFLQSVEKQTYPHWEVVIVDDNSTDETPQVSQQFAERHPGKVKCIKMPENRGFTPAVERGIRQASGALLMYMGDDDVIMPEMLEKGVAEFNRNPDLGLVYANLWQDEQIGGKQHFSSTYTGIQDRKLTPAEFLDLKIHRKAMCAQYTMFRKDVFNALGGFKSDIQDVDIFFRISVNYHICYIPQVLALNRKHDANLIKEKFEHYAKTRMAYWREKQQEIDDPEFQEKLKQYFVQMRMAHASVYLQEGNFNYALFRKHALSLFRDVEIYTSWRPYAYIALALMPQSMYLLLKRTRNILNQYV